MMLKDRIVKRWKLLLVLICVSWKRSLCYTKDHDNHDHDQQHNHINEEECSIVSQEHSNAIDHVCKYKYNNDANNRQFKWDLDAQHTCNVKRMSLDQLLNVYPGGLPPLYHEPLLIYNTNNDYTIPSPLTGCRQDLFAHKSSLSNIVSSLPKDFNITLSSSNSFSAHRRTIPLTQYIQETTSTETYPHQLSNETWYLFGETYSGEWKLFLQDYCLPPCQTCTDEWSALAFGIGGRGSGVQWHTHGPGFSQSIHGRKHWVLYPPNQKPVYNPDYTSRYWMEETYTKMLGGTKGDGEEEERKGRRPYECTLLPGEMIYFPDKWHHATINLDAFTVFVSTFTTEHGF